MKNLLKQLKNVPLLCPHIFFIKIWPKHITLPYLTLVRCCQHERYQNISYILLNCYSWICYLGYNYFRRMLHLIVTNQPPSHCLSTLLFVLLNQYLRTQLFLKCHGTCDEPAPPHSLLLSLFIILNHYFRKCNLGYDYFRRTTFYFLVTSLPHHTPFPRYCL